MFLQDPQKGDLRFCRQLSDLIEKDRAPLGQFKSSHTPLNCPGKGTFLMAKQL